MATLVRIDHLYINLDTVAWIKAGRWGHGSLRVGFAGSPEMYIELSGNKAARLLKWLDRVGRVSVVGPLPIHAATPLDVGEGTEKEMEE